MEALQLQLPKGLAVLETQVAGHTFDASTLALGMLKDETLACVLKPMGKPECGARELSFYESLQKTTDPVLKAAINFVPRYHKNVNLVVNSKEHAFLQLEDLTHGMENPCIMDIKVGKRTWDPLASPRKRKVEENKYFQCKQVLGLCLPGFQVYSERGCLKYGKEFGKKLDSNGLYEAIKMFLNAQSGVCQPLVGELLRQLYNIRLWFREQRILHFYASSLLIVYDYKALRTLQSAQSNSLQKTINGNVDMHLCNGKDVNAFQTTITHNDINHICLEDSIKVKMIDFAHVFPSKNSTIDMNYLFGLESLIGILEDMLQR